MTIAASVDMSASSNADGPIPDKRSAPRFTSLIRAAKLVSPQGEFVCVVRDVSSGGVRLRCFHEVPHGPGMALELHNREVLAIERIRQDGFEASFRFAEHIPIERLISDAQFYPRRLLRLNIAIPLTLRTLGGPVAAVTRNISQQGCRVECAMPLALAQPLTIETPHLPSIRAKVRWRQESECGLVFDDTFSLKDFAVRVARLQCPALVAG